MNKVFSTKNFIGFAVATVMLVVGFFLLGQKPSDNSLALNVAPVLLVLAYLVVLPISILWGGTNEKKEKA